VAWAANISAPVGTISSRLQRAHGSRWRSSAETASGRERPSRRASNMRAAPTSVTKPTMWTISTIG
jgi:hypothetical protein